MCNVRCALLLVGRQYGSCRMRSWRVVRLLWLLRCSCAAHLASGKLGGSRLTFSLILLEVLFWPAGHRLPAGAVRENLAESNRNSRMSVHASLTAASHCFTCMSATHWCMEIGTCGMICARYASQSQFQMIRYMRSVCCRASEEHCVPLVLQTVCLTTTSASMRLH